MLKAQACGFNLFKVYESALFLFSNYIPLISKLTLNLHPPYAPVGRRRVRRALPPPALRLQGHHAR